MDDLEVCRLAAAAGADVVREHFGAAVTAEWKGATDPVTEVDRVAERAVISVIAAHRPNDRVLAEESGGHDWNDGRVWIVDPLDGTVNFVHGFPHVATSVGLRSDGVGLVGVVESVINRETFSAAAGRGAHLNGTRIQVSAQPDLGRALVGTGFAYNRREHAQELSETLARVLQKVQGIRRVGSAALDLCWVAAGRMDAYWESGVKPWDTAAGTLIVSEAGGRVTTYSGDRYPLDDPRLVSSNGTIHAALLEAIN